ncbi:MAG TPA: hypothetical protein VE974_10670 [Thermoanaerobaculia bacterium]|nr:hypothetical protein [Thermoanaerobaculia bacterium]
MPPQKQQQKLQQKQQLQQQQQLLQLKQAKNSARTYAKQLFPKREDFYPTLKDLAAQARKGVVTAQQSVADIVKRFETDTFFHDEIANRVRVKATTMPGDAKGVGLDELFKTSETMEFLKRDAGMVQGVEPVSRVTFPNKKTVELTWLDLQEKIRLPTSDVLTKEGEGHTGALRPAKDSKGYMLKGQAELHAARHKAIKAATTPLKGLHAAFKGHLEVTPNLIEMTKVLNNGFDIRNRDLSNPKEKAQSIKYFDRGRQYVKSFAREFGRLSSPTTKSFSPQLSPDRYPSDDKFKLSGDSIPHIYVPYNAFRQKL